MQEELLPQRLRIRWKHGESQGSCQRMGDGLLQLLLQLLQVRVRVLLRPTRLLLAVLLLARLPQHEAQAAQLPLLALAGVLLLLLRQNLGLQAQLSMRLVQRLLLQQQEQQDLESGSRLLQGALTAQLLVLQRHRPLVQVLLCL